MSCGAAGYWGISKLSASLEFISGPAWNTADGAMEGTIGVDSQMLGIERTLTGRGNIRTLQLIRDGKSMEDEALGRMVDAGLLTDSQVGQTNTKRREFRESYSKVLDSYSIFDTANQRLSKNFFAFQKFMEKVEEIGDGQVEALRRNPNKAVSWNGGLRLRWIAADGAMEPKSVCCSAATSTLA